VREAVAVIRADWLTQISYRLRMLFSVAALVIPVIPLYFVAQALQPVIAESIRDEGEQYFGFLVAGMIAMSFLSTAVNILPTQIGSGIRTGTLEAVLSTPARLGSLLLGAIGFHVSWTALRSATVLVAAWVFGANVAWHQIMPSAVILLLTFLTYLPFGILAGALILAFRTAGPLSRGVLYLSTLLGGVYYPTKIIPSWIQYLSDWIPLTYGLRALRRVLLEGASLPAVTPEILTMCGFGVVLFSISASAFSVALRYAKRSGTLAQY
jgi:ABC-2 type transport system permease protein